MNVHLSESALTLYMSTAARMMKVTTQKQFLGEIQPRRQIGR
jgi:hypothetical protein